MRFDLTDLQLFAHILDAGTMTAAAERSHITLASASERIRGMESQLGCSLLIRKARGVQPTAAGHTLGQHARQVLQQMQLLRGAMGEFGAGLAGQIRLRGNTSAIREHLPLAISGFLQQHRQIALEMHECTSAEVLDGLRQGLCDIGVAAWEMPGPQSLQDQPSLAGLTCLPWRADPLVVVLPALHPLAQHTQLAMADLLQENWIGLPRDYPLQQQLQKQALRLNGQLLRMQVQLPHFEGLCQLVGHNVGVTVLPLAAAQRYAAATAHADIAIVALSDAWAQRQLLLCTTAQPLGAGPSRQLLEHLQRSATESLALSNGSEKRDAGQ